MGVPQTKAAEGGRFPGLGGRATAAILMASLGESSETASSTPHIDCRMINMRTSGVFWRLTAELSKRHLFIRHAEKQRSRRSGNSDDFSLRQPATARAQELVVHVVSTPPTLQIVKPSPALVMGAAMTQTG